MYFSVAEQEISCKDVSVRFEVDKADTSNVLLTVSVGGEPKLVARLSRNGYPVSVEEPVKPEPKQELADDGYVKSDGPQLGYDQPQPVSGGAKA